MRTWAAIPYRDKPELTCGILGQLAHEDALEGVVLLDHASTPETDAALVECLAAIDRLMFVSKTFPAETTLTEMWNAAVDISEAEEVESLAFLNNDIAIPAGFIGHLEAALWADDALWAVCPDWHRAVAQGVDVGPVRYVSGAERHGGMCGWAFMVKVGAWTRGGLARFDPQFRWWCGDDDIAFAIEAAGYKVGLLEGLPVDHMTSQTLVTRPELVSVCHEDLARCKAKWGR